MDYIKTTSRAVLGEKLRAAIALPVECMHKTLGKGQVTNISFSPYKVDLIITCNFDQITIGFSLEAINKSKVEQLILAPELEKVCNQILRALQKNMEVDTPVLSVEEAPVEELQAEKPLVEEPLVEVLEVPTLKTVDAETLILEDMSEVKPEVEVEVEMPETEVEPLIAEMFDEQVEKDVQVILDASAEVSPIDVIAEVAEDGGDSAEVVETDEAETVSTESRKKRK